jgi:endonuclease/exonuclease/phosphatase family metal-dependent hydrolase
MHPYRRMLVGLRLVLSSMVFVVTGVHAETSYVVGAWNLEHFHEGAKRGFPEGTIRARRDSDYQFIASLIKQIDAKILVLEEINGELVDIVDDEEGPTEVVRSPELDKLIGFLGDSYDYVIADSGGSQRIALLFDTKFVQLNEACETDFTNTEVQGKGLFDRQPLYGHFTFLENNQERNDLVVVGVHLASGQHLNRNHDQAMKRIVRELAEARAEGFCIPDDEFDVLIAGDFNANRFAGAKETFWNKMENSGWDVLGDDGDNYSATRLSGKPLGLKSSKIDYIIVSKGLAGREVATQDPTIHTDLISTPDQFRLKASDHLPITVKVKVTADAEDGPT